jgi:RNA polymerase sigma factor (sigma-70 family)
MSEREITFLTPAINGNELSADLMISDWEDSEPTNEELEKLDELFELRVKPDLENTDPEDTLKYYFNEVGQYDLLSSQEEKQLMRKIRKGVKFTGKVASLTIQEATEEGQEALDKMIGANLRLPIWVALKYQGKAELLDMIQAGNRGLMTAVAKFDEKRGFRFGTYATWWIRQSVLKELDKRKLIHLPAWIQDKVLRYFRVWDAMEEEMGRVPTITELAEKLNVPEVKLKRDIKLLIDPISLNKEVETEDGETELIDFVADWRGDPQEIMEEKDAREKLWEYVNRQLPDFRERQVFIWRKGLEDNQVLTFQEISQRLGISSEHVKLLEKTALKKLRGHKRLINDLF